MSRFFLSAATMFCVCLLSSCSHSDGPRVVALAGMLTLDGMPLSDKHVQFVPEAETVGQGAGARLAGDGTYELIAIRPGTTVDVFGAPPGVYRVVVTEPRISSVAITPVADHNSLPAAVGLPDRRRAKSSAVPRRYRDPETTPLRVEVPQQGGTIDLELTTRP